MTSGVDLRERVVNYVREGGSKAALKDRAKQYYLH